MDMDGVMLGFVAAAVWLTIGGLLIAIAAMNGIVPFVLVLIPVGTAWTLLQIAKPPRAPRSNG
jgi:hypothetical protein